MLFRSKIFEFNTAKNQAPAVAVQQSPEVLVDVNSKLKNYFTDDTAKLDALLGTAFSKEWFAAETIKSI